MAAGIGLLVKISGDTKDAVGDIRDVNRALEGTGQTTGRTSKAFGAMKGPAIAALAGIAGAAGAAVVSMVEFGKAAWEDHQEAEKLAFTLKKIPGITQDMVAANEAWITQTMFATHVLDTDLREAIGQLTIATGDLTEAQKLATLAADVAVGANMEYGTVVNQLTKAVGGKTNALMKNMPWLDANKDGTLELSEALAGLTKKYGGAAAAAAENDPWTTLQIIFDELKESLGQWIIPLFTKLGNWFKDPANQKKIQEFIDKVGDLAFELGNKLLPKLEQFLAWIASPQGKQQMKDWARTAENIAKAVIKIADALGKLLGWWNKLPGPLKGIVGGDMPMPFAAAPAPVGVAPMAAVPTARVSSGTTINFYGPVGDQEATARAIVGVLNRSDRRMQRSASARAGEPRW